MTLKCADYKILYDDMKDIKMLCEYEQIIRQYWRKILTTFIWLYYNIK